MTSELLVRPPLPSEFQTWAPLFRAYREFYELAPDETVVQTVWGWLQDPLHEENALVAEQDGELIGLAHYRRFARPSRGGMAMFLDDLITGEGYRGAGVGRALIEAIQALAVEEGCNVLRWTTAFDNATAQRLYDQLAQRTQWLTYDIDLTQ
jgi:GNAT superfamily N-acetyltransferase